MKLHEGFETLEEQAQANLIAAVCPHVCHKSRGGDYYCWNDGTEYAHSVFNPVRDLNAMHAAEMTLLKTDRWDAYKWTLAQTVYRDDVQGDIGDISTAVVCADAPQRAGAFVRTLNL